MIRRTGPKRLIAILVMAVLAALPSTPAAATSGFGDVEAELYYSDAVQWMVNEGITTGTTPTCFSPDQPVTRGQAAAFFHRMEGEPVTTTDHQFVDVVEAWQQDPVSWMVETGITTGTTPTTYSPDDTLTRGQFAALLHRLEGEPAADDHPFVDIVEEWQQAPVAWLAEQTITTGTSPDTFSPDGVVTRAQLAAFLYRYRNSPPVTADPSSPLCELTRTPRVVTETGFGVMATTGTVTLTHPAERIEVIGWHESNHDGAQQLEPSAEAATNVVMETRHRGNGSHTSADIVVDPVAEIRAPVTGTVIRAGGYVLYCNIRDEFVVIEPDDQPGWEVKMFHIDGLQVSTGDRVEAGVTVLAGRATQLPFTSQVDGHSAEPSWPHVHVEVVDPSIPDRPGRGC